MYLKTAYGMIPTNELKVQEIPDEPSVFMDIYANKLYDNEFDHCGANIWIYLNDGTKEKLTKNSEMAITDIGYVRIGSSPHNVSLPFELTPKLAYFVGYIYGDGGFKDIRRSKQVSNRFDHKVIVADEFKIQVNIIADLFFELFNIKTPVRDERIKKGENVYYVNPTCKMFYRFFVKIFDFPEGPKKNLSIPKIIKDAPQEIRKWFIRGFFDADGDVKSTEAYINRKLPKPRVKVRLADLNFVKQLKECLIKDFGLPMTGPYTDSGSDWYIQGAKNAMIKAGKQMLFTHPIKAWRINKFLEIINNK